MPEAGEIKAKVVIEYDGSGIDKAKDDLKSLAEIAGGELTEGTGAATDALSNLDEQMGKNAESTGTLADSVEELHKPLEAGTDALTSMTDAAVEHQSAIEDTGSAYETLQKPLETATSFMEEDASPAMMEMISHSSDLQEQLGGMGDSFTQMGESLSQAAPLLPQFAENMQDVHKALGEPLALPGLHDAMENFAVFQDALENPSPFSMIQQHLAETGQTWGDFSSSIGEENTSFLHDMASNASVSHEVLGGMSSDVQATGKVFAESATATEEFTKQWNSLGETIAEPAKGGGLFESFGQGSAGGLFGGIMEGMNKIAMPIMAAQMIGMAVGAAATGIYNMAALAEGPAAHGVGTFTGAIDQLGQHAQETAQTFSESFGKGLLPSIDAINNVMATSNESDFWSNLGSGLGTVTGVLGDATQILGGGLVGGLMKTLTLNPGNTTGESWIAAGWEGLQNTWAGITGQAEPFPGPGYAASGPNVNMPQIQQQLAQNTAMMNAQASNPQYLAAQAYLQSQSSDAKIGQTIYDAGHMTGMDVFDYTPQAYQRSMMSQVASMPYAQRGISDVDINRAFFGSMDTSNAPLSYPGVDANWNHPSCFPAGTRVLMADGREQAIETLQIGDRVLAHNGTKQMVATILARIKPLPKLVYKLSFSNGNNLTLTDAHPISSLHGWKSINPEETKKENPDLVVTILQIGDTIHTAKGLCTLETIRTEEVVPIYNITVDEPHTFYANGVLVHNKISADIMSQVADTTIPHTDLKGSNLIDSLASNFSGASMAHTFTATVNWAAEGLEKGFTAVASWAATGLAQDFLAVASWAATGLQQAYTATVNWASQGLSQAYTAVANWTGENLIKPFTAAATWAATGLEKAYTAVANWTGENLIKPFTAAATWAAEGLEHTFEGITNWVAQGLEHTFNAIASWTVSGGFASFTSSIPGFASGVQNFGGGLAVVGENGPELIHLPQGASVYPQIPSSGGFPQLNTGESGMVTINVTHMITLDGRTIAQGTIPYLAPMARAVSGRRQ